MNIDLTSIEYSTLIKLFEDVCHIYRRAQAQKRSIGICGFWSDLFVALDNEINRRLREGFDTEEGAE